MTAILIVILLAAACIALMIIDAVSCKEMKQLEDTWKNNDTKSQ